MAVSDDESDDEEADLFYFNSHLVPQRSKRTCTRVIKFYWFWIVLCTSHIYVFFSLPDSVAMCKDTLQVDASNNSLVFYGDPGYRCNTFNNNGWIITFYLFLCVYFGL